MHGHADTHAHAYVTEGRKLCGRKTLVRLIDIEDTQCIFVVKRMFCLVYICFKKSGLLKHNLARVKFTRFSCVI